jgi:hypothetical protein
MIGFVAFDLILRRVGARVVSVALIVEVMRVDPNDRAADAPGLRVPTDSISNFVPFSHWVFLVVQASSELRSCLRHHRQGGLDRETRRSRRTTLGRRLPIVMPDEQMRSAAEL